MHALNLKAIFCLIDMAAEGRGAIGSTSASTVCHARPGTVCWTESSGQLA